MLPRRRPTGPLVLTAVLAAAITILGCAQKEDERCEIDSDCAAELVCVTISVQNHKTCRPRGSATPTPLVDGGGSAVDMPPLIDGPPDSPATDRPPEAAPDAQDTPAVDAGVEAPRPDTGTDGKLDAGDASAG